MKVSKRSQYALRAILELSIRNSGKPLKAKDIAKSQGISLRFLEIILNDLKHAGFVISRRGNEGGYILSKEPAEIYPRDIIEYIEGSTIVGPAESEFRNGAIKRLWDNINGAIAKVCTDTNFAEMVEYETFLRESESPSYCI